MICTTIINKDIEGILSALETCEMAEIRLDSCQLSLKDIDECFSSDVPLVATCRVADVIANDPTLQGPTLSEQSRKIKAMQIVEKRLVRAIEAGARYVDVEIEVEKHLSKRIRSVAHENGTIFIRSYHDFEGTGTFADLLGTVEKCRYHGADLVKLVTMAHSQDDVDRVMSLYDCCDDLVAFCMGEAGKQSRVECLRRGAPYTYAALTADEAAAPGQWPMDEMKAAVYGKHNFIESPVLQMPCSKSFAQRAIIAAALADGESHLKGYTPCGDNEAAIFVSRNLGADVQVEGSDVKVSGIGASAGCLGDITDLNVGESGLLTRMVIPLVAQLCPNQVTLTGKKTLLGRPLTGAKEIMDAFGAKSQSCNDGEVLCVPLNVKGPLKPGRTDISGKHGSQIISGLLMALPFADRNSTVVVKDPKSIPYMFITLEVLKKFGIKVGNEMLGGRDFLESNGDWSLCTEMVFKVKGDQKFKATDMTLEGDWSAAANFLVAGAIFGKTELKGLDTTSLQADLSIMDILMDAGASLSQTDGNQGNLSVQRAPLKCFNVDASNCPDLFPIISVLAAFCQGTSCLAGVGRLANKESDRAKAIIGMLTKMGVKAWIEGDEMFIEGHTLVQRLLGKAPMLKGGSYTSHHDHRMVMALKVAAFGADTPITIDDEECVAKSFPQFHEIFDQIRLD